MRFVSALTWESLQNLPMIAGFLIAARLVRANLVPALLVTLVGILLGVVLMHLTERRLHPQPYRATLKGDLINGLTFFVLAVPFLFYFGDNHENPGGRLRA